MHPNNHKRYKRQKKHSTIKNVLFFALLFIIGSAVAFFLVHDDIFPSIGSNDNDDLTPQIHEDDQSSRADAFEQIFSDLYEPVEENINAIYFNVELINDVAYVENIFNVISEGKFNALVLPMKNRDGSFNYFSNLEYSSVNMHSRDLTNIITQAVNEDVYLIADVSVFCDSNFSKTYENSTFKTYKNAIWTDNEKNAWISPYCDVGFLYITEILNELSNIGFNEFLLRDFHFPVLGDVNSISYAQDLVSKEEILASRLFDLSQNYNISLLTSNFALSEENFLSGEQNLQNLSENIKNLYVTVDTDDIYDSYLALDIDNKAIFTYIYEYSNNQTNYIIH